MARLNQNTCILYFAEKTHKKIASSGMMSSTSSTSRLSTAEICNIVEKLKLQRFRDSTRATYYRVWHLFSKFFLCLDYKPDTWEQRIVLFAGFLINNNLQSSSVKSYISAIRSVLIEDGHNLREDTFLITSLMRACKLKNDKLTMRLPIYRELLRVILEETKNYLGKHKNQPYLKTL